MLNANEIADISTRQTTEYHSRRARVIRLSLNQLLNGTEENIIQVQPTIREEQNQNEVIINNERMNQDHLVNNNQITLTEVRSSSNNCSIICSIVCMLLVCGLFGALIAHLYIA